MRFHAGAITIDLVPTFRGRDPGHGGGQDTGPGAGFGVVRASRFQRHGHALAGLSVAVCGLLVRAAL